MSRYEVQFKSSGVVAFSASERWICQHWMDYNNHAEDVPVVDPDTGEVVGYSQGECLNLFTLVKVRSTEKGN